MEKISGIFAWKLFKKMKTLPIDDQNQGIFFHKLGNFFQFLKKGRGDLPPWPLLVTHKVTTSLMRCLFTTILLSWNKVLSSSTLSLSFSFQNFNEALLYTHIFQTKEIINFSCTKFQNFMYMSIHKTDIC